MYCTDRQTDVRVYINIYKKNPLYASTYNRQTDRQIDD